MRLNNTERNALAFFIIFSGFAFQVDAVQPTDVSFCARGKLKADTKYSIYSVLCSDGKKYEITAWHNSRRWCVGTSEKRCAENQLKAAKMACMGQ